VTIELGRAPGLGLATTKRHLPLDAL